MTQSTRYLKKWFVIILAVRLIALLFTYPCEFDYDSAVGLRTFLSPANVSVTCNHHPVFVQAIHALFYTFGAWIGHRSVGMFILALIHVFLSSSILIYGIRLIAKAGTSSRWCNVVACVFAFFPVFIFLSLLPTKDGFFNYSLLLYVFTIYEMYISGGMCMQDKRFMLMHAISIILVCLTRHQGIYIIVLETFLLFVSYRACCKKLLCYSISSIMFVVGFNELLLPKLNVEPGGKQEIYQMFFQQTANYLRLYPQDVTQEELKTIGSILNLDSIVRNYNLIKADPVKNTYKYKTFSKTESPRMTIFVNVDKTGEAEALADYRKVWLNMALRHPEAYFSATLNVVSGYLWSFYQPLIYVYCVWDVQSCADVTGYSYYHVKKFNALYYKLYKKLFFSKSDNGIVAILRILFSTPIYMWMSLLLLAFYLCKSRSLRDLTLVLPMVLSVGVCVMTAYAYARYAYPVFMMVPVLLSEISMQYGKR